MASIAAALVAELDDADLQRLAERLAPLLAPSEPPTEDRWLCSRDAAIYLGLSLHAVHKLTAARAIPFEQDGPGCKCWFKRSELDAWVRAGRPPKTPRV